MEEQAGRDISEDLGCGACVFDFPGNPRQHPRPDEMITWAPDEFQQWREMLLHHALIVTKGLFGLAELRAVKKAVVSCEL
jgi:hypothetical protein